MYTCRPLVPYFKYVILFLIIYTNQISAKEPLVIGLGEKLSSSEIKLYNMTIFPNGKNLPDGFGTAAKGKEVFKQCRVCHGDKGIEGPAARLVGSNGWGSFSDPLRILRIKKYPILLISVGSTWPYATSIFDYIRRAMPHYDPKSLTDKEVYEVTAYILYLNGLISKDYTLDRKSILKVKMPGKDRSYIQDKKIRDILRK